ncbi:MAG TPA: hypothetical protein VGK63_12365 [Candidatus Limnocylindrales bacterium]
MIRNVVIHLANEQPLMADLPVAPVASDISLICTNLRTLNGKRPVFADDAASLFVFPYAHIRFLEVSPAALAAADVATAAGGGESIAGPGMNGHSTAAAIVAAAAEAARESAPGTSGPADGGAGAIGGANPTAADDVSDAARAGGGSGAGPVEDDLETDLEIDEDFLRRVREI